MTQLASSPPPRRTRADADGRHARRLAAPVAAAPDGFQRGRHATPIGQGFGWVVTWTIIGAIVPGAGLIAAGRRTAGWLMLVATAVVTCLSGLYLISVGVSLKTLAGRAVDPTFLLEAAIALAAAAVVMLIVLLVTHAALRHEAALTTTQRLGSAALVLALVIAVCGPLGTASSYVLIERDVLTSVFQASPSSSKTSAVPKVEKADPWATIPRVNVLLVGSDAGSDRIGIRPDTMILASINTHTGDTVLFSIPRNLVRAPFPAGSPGAQAWPDGFGPLGASGFKACDPAGSNTKEYCWINAVWTTANSPSGKKYFAGEANPGLTATEEAVQGVTGLHVDYYAMLNLRGFADFVDAIGGITVNIYNKLPIGGDSTHHVATGGWLKAGMHQHLNGYKTLWFARSRWSTDDYDRMRRQRCVIGAVSQQADPTKLAAAFPKLAASMKSNLSTDIPLNQLSAWVDLTMRVKKAHVRSLPLTPSVYTMNGVWYEVDYDKIHQLVQTNIHRPATTPSPTVSPTTSAGTSPTRTTHPKTTKAPVDPTKAQDVTQVC